MGEPELRSDEKILVRTQEVYIKSIPFEGILTNKRIILLDRAKNLLPQKEIPLVTIKDVEPGENAIRDQTLTLSVVAKTGETRQMILTFSRQSGGNRIKERNEWAKVIKENTTSSFEQVIRKVIPGLGQAPKKAESATPQRIEIIGSPIVQKTDTPVRTTVKKEADGVSPIKKIIETKPAAVKEVSTPAPSFGTYCSRCGNQVSEGSVFCNRCGSQIVVPKMTAPPAVQAPQSYAPEVTTAKDARPIEKEIQTTEPPIERSSIKAPSDPLRVVPPEPQVQKPVPQFQDVPPLIPGLSPTEQAPTPAIPPAVPPKKSKGKGLISRLFSPKAFPPAPLNPESIPAGGMSPSPQKPKRGFGFKQTKRMIAGIAVIAFIIIAVAIGAFFLYPMVTKGGIQPPGGTNGSQPSSITPAQVQGTFVVPVETPPSSVPVTDVYVHINYIGGWTGSYGMPKTLQSVTDSGDRLYEIANATGPVQAAFEKLDGSTRHELMVEIYKNGKLLTSGKTSNSFGKVMVSADATTGAAQIPQTGNATSTSTTTTAKPTTTITTVRTTAPVTNTTTKAT